MSTNAAPVKNSTNDRKNRLFEEMHRSMNTRERGAMGEEDRGKDEICFIFRFVSRFCFWYEWNGVAPTTGMEFFRILSVRFVLSNSSEMTVYIKCSGMHRTQNGKRTIRRTARKVYLSLFFFSLFRFSLVAVGSRTCALVYSTWPCIRTHINCVVRDRVCRKGHTLDLGRPVLHVARAFSHTHSSGSSPLGHLRCCWAAGASWIVWFIHNVINLYINAIGAAYENIVSAEWSRREARKRRLAITSTEYALTRALHSPHDESCDEYTDNVRQQSVCVQLGKCPFPRNSYQMECDFDDNFLQ